MSAQLCDVLWFNPLIVSCRLAASLTLRLVNPGYGNLEVGLISRMRASECACTKRFWFDNDEK